MSKKSDKPDEIEALPDVDAYRDLNAAESSSELLPSRLRKRETAWPRAARHSRQVIIQSNPNGDISPPSLPIRIFGGSEATIEQVGNNSMGPLSNASLERGLPSYKPLKEIIHGDNERKRISQQPAVEMDIVPRSSRITSPCSDITINDVPTSACNNLRLAVSDSLGGQVSKGSSKNLASSQYRQNKPVVESPIGSPFPHSSQHAAVDLLIPESTPKELVNQREPRADSSSPITRHRDARRRHTRRLQEGALSPYPKRFQQDLYSNCSDETCLSAKFSRAGSTHSDIFQQGERRPEAPMSTTTVDTTPIGCLSISHCSKQESLNTRDTSHHSPIANPYTVSSCGNSFQPLRQQRKHCPTSKSSPVPSSITSPGLRYSLAPLSSENESTEQEQSRILRMTFEDQSVGLMIAEYLKSSEIRCLIYILQLINYPVAGYFEMLCRRVIGQLELSNLVNEYLGTLSTGRMTMHNSDGNNLDQDDDDVEFVRSSFQPFIPGDPSGWGSPAQRAAVLPPYQLIYQVEIFGRYCDECNSLLRKPISFPPDLVRISDGESLLPPRVREENIRNNEKIKIEEEDCQGLQRLLSGRHIDRSITNLVLCPSCYKQFIERKLLDPVLQQLMTAAPILIHSQFLEAITEPQFDHAGQLMERKNWNSLSTKFINAQKKFMECVRGNFTKRISRRFGSGFYQTFVQKLLPPEEFLAQDEKRRISNPIRWLAVRRLRSRRSNFCNPPVLERYPVGSLERGVALLIRADFKIWVSSVDVKQLVDAETAITRKLKIAHDILGHPNYLQAAATVQDFVLTRKVNRERFDLIFVTSLWRVLFRGKTREPRTFRGNIFDRQRIDKFFAQCLEGVQPSLTIKGYLGFESEDEATSTSKKQMTPRESEPTTVMPESHPTPVHYANLSGAERLALALKAAGHSIEVFRSTDKNRASI